MCLSRPLEAQRSIEWQARALGVVSGATFVGGGVGVAARPGARLRVGADAGAGSREGRTAGRFELLVSYHLITPRPRRVIPYAGGGAAVTVTGAASEEFVLVVLGVEAPSTATLGWFGEVGLAGGLRFAAGVRFRP